MVIGEGLTVLETELKPIDPDQIEVHKFFGYKQAGKIDGELVIERVKKRIERMEQLLVMNLCNINLIKAINYGVIPVAGYVNNVLDLRKSDLEDLHKIVKSTVRDKKCHGRESSEENLYVKKYLGTGLKRL